MCGLIAVSQGHIERYQIKHECANDEQSIRQSIESLAAIQQGRGPDAQNFKIHEQLGFYLLHQRLVQVGQANKRSNQPIVEGPLSIMVNGEFYDYLNIKQVLMEQGCVFQTDTDSEILLHLYKYLGQECYYFLEGEFAFIIIDSQQKQIHLAVDRFGVRPLHYVSNSAGLSVASNSRVLAKLTDASIQEESIEQMVAMQYLVPTKTIFEGVENCAGGQWIRFSQDSGNAWQKQIMRLTDLMPNRVKNFASLGAQDLRHYLQAKKKDSSLDVFSWRAKSEESQSLKKEKNNGPNQYVKIFKEHLDQAVQRRQKQSEHGQQASFLSGGLDSACVSASLKEQATGLQCLIHAQFTQTDAFYNEFPKAKAQARAMQLEDKLKAIDCIYEHDEGTLIDDFLTGCRWANNPSINLHMAAKVRMAKYLKDNKIRVAYSGEGADELLYGYVHLQSNSHALANQGYVAGIQLPTESLEADQICWFAAKLQWGKKVQTLLNEQWAKKMSLIKIEKVFNEQLTERFGNDFQHLDLLKKSQLSWLYFAFENYILKTLEDAPSSMQGVEGRLAFLDSRVWAYVSSLSMEQIRPNQVNKGILKQAYQEQLAPEILNVDKQSFMAPVFYQYPKTLMSFVDYVNKIPFSFFDKQKVLDKLNQLQQQKQYDSSWEAAFLYALSLESVASNHGD